MSSAAAPAGIIGKHCSDWSTRQSTTAVRPEAIASGRTAVVDCRVDQSEQCFPMIPAGAAALEMVEYEEPEEQEAHQ